jgi:hypothetical protein
MILLQLSRIQWEPAGLSVCLSTRPALIVHTEHLDRVALLKGELIIVARRRGEVLCRFGVTTALLLLGGLIAKQET